jgi:uncharacterized protein (DUF433 family)
MVEVVEEYLKLFDFQLDEVQRWWPLGRKSAVVVDPKRRFGAPTLHGKVAVETVLEYLKAGESEETVAALLGLSIAEVRDAIIWRERTEAAA